MPNQTLALAEGGADADRPGELRLAVLFFVDLSIRLAGLVCSMGVLMKRVAAL